MCLLLFSIFILVFTPFVCPAQQTELKAYFFPYSSLFKGKIYKYINEDNPNDIVYQLTKSTISHGDTLLTLRRYDQYFQELETMTQSINDTGVSLKRYSLYIAGENIDSRVIQHQVYQWQQATNEPIKWAVRYQSPYGEEGFRKMRQVVTTSIVYRFHDTAYTGVEFKDDFRHSVKSSQNVRTNDFHQYSKYAKGLGLVAYDRTLVSGEKLRYRLEKIMDLNSWEILKKRPQQPFIRIKRT